MPAPAAELDVEALLEMPFKKDATTNGKRETHESKPQNPERRRSSSITSSHRSPHSSRRRSRSRERESRYSSDRRSSSHRSSRRDSSKERHSRQSHDKARSRERDRDRESRHGSRREYSDRYRDRDYDRHRDGRNRRTRSRSRSHSPSRKRHRSVTPSRRPSSPELTEESRDRRTVFVQQLAARLTNDQLRDFFSEAGPVREAKIIVDRISRRSKGVAYVEFRNEESVHKAIEKTGQKLLGIPVIVQYTEAEKNRQAMLKAEAEAPKAAQNLARDGPMNRLYVGNLHHSVREADLRKIFEPYGRLDYVKIHFETDNGTHKGYAFVQFKRSDNAKEAMQAVDGFELAGRNLRVNLSHDSRGSKSYSSLDDHEIGGVAMNNASRVDLMQKLARSAEMKETSLGSSVSSPSVPPSPMAKPSCHVLLSNMFNPEEETEPNWQDELGEEVKSECEKAYGKITFVHVEKDSPGEIYVKFESISAATKAVEGLNGRWFGGRKIEAKFVLDAIFQARFPASKSK